MTDQDPHTYALIGAATEVHAELGHGFLEKVYHEALIRELGTRVIPFQRECELPIFYRERLPCVYRADLICFGIIVELKALSRLSGTERSQVLNYLKASGVERGLVLNFGSDRLPYERFVL